MNAIITAGGIPKPEDPLFAYTQGNSKALLDIAGKPMAQWVLDALQKSPKIHNIVVIGLNERDGLNASEKVVFLPNQGKMLANIVAGFKKIKEMDPSSERIIIASSDIPGITTEMVEWLINEVEKDPSDIHYGVIKKEVMEKRYPDSRRTWSALKDMEVCGADISVANYRMATEHLNTWEELIGSRKSPFRQAATIGFMTLILFVMKKLTLEDAVRRVSESLKIKGKAIVWPWAEAGMDVDKPHQLEILRRDFAAKPTDRK